MQSRKHGTRVTIATSAWRMKCDIIIITEHSKTIVIVLQLWSRRGKHQQLLQQIPQTLEQLHSQWLQDHSAHITKNGQGSSHWISYTSKTMWAKVRPLLLRHILHTHNMHNMKQQASHLYIFSLSDDLKYQSHYLPSVLHWMESLWAETGNQSKQSKLYQPTQRANLVGSAWEVPQRMSSWLYALNHHWLILCPCLEPHHQHFLFDHHLPIIWECIANNDHSLISWTILSFST